MLVADVASIDCCSDGLPMATCPGRLSGGADWLLEKLWPEHPLPYLLAGVAALAASNLETFEGSAARPVMVTLGGASLAVGGLPVLIKMFKGEKISW